MSRSASDKYERRWLLLGISFERLLHLSIAEHAPQDRDRSSEHSVASGCSAGLVYVVEGLVAAAGAFAAFLTSRELLEG